MEARGARGDVLHNDSKEPVQGWSPCVGTETAEGERSRPEEVEGRLGERSSAEEVDGRLIPRHAASSQQRGTKRSKAPREADGPSL